jgi:hypothetical protein
MEVILIAVCALVGLPFLADLACLFGVRVWFRPSLRVTKEPLNRYLVLRFVTGALATLVLASLFLNVGWLRILFGVGFLAHVVAFRALSVHHLRTHRGRVGLAFWAAWLTFVLGYFLLPDFGDAPESEIAFFGLLRDPSLIEGLLAASGLLLLVNLATMVWLLTQSRYKKGGPPEVGPPSP